MKGFVYCSSLYQKIYYIFHLERRSQVTTIPNLTPTPRKFLNHLKICHELSNTPLHLQDTLFFWVHWYPKTHGPHPCAIPQKTQRCFASKTLENGLSVNIMAVFTASEDVCVLQVACKRRGNNMWREVSKYGAIYSLQIYRALPTRNRKDTLCRILHILLSNTPFLFSEKKKVSYINQRANI